MKLLRWSVALKVTNTVPSHCVEAQATSVSDEIFYKIRRKKLIWYASIAASHHWNVAHSPIHPHIMKNSLVTLVVPFLHNKFIAHGFFKQNEVVDCIYIFNIDLCDVYLAE